MKFEPLTKEKIIKLGIDERTKWAHETDIKSAVHGLLQEVKENIEEVNRKLKNPEIDEITKYQLIAGKYWLVKIRNLIKKWFKGVLE